MASLPSQLPAMESQHTCHPTSPASMDLVRFRTPEYLHDHVPEETWWTSSIKSLILEEFHMMLS